MITRAPWEHARLGDVADLLTGFPFKSEKYTESDDSIRLVRGDNIVQGALRWDGVKKWPLSERNEYRPYELQTGDVVLAMDRPWIEAGLKYSAISGHDLPCLLVQRTARLRGGPKLDTRFLRYIIGSKEFTRHIHAITTGTAVPHISAGQIKDFKFLLPPVDQQKAIAHILGTLDDKIELNRRMNATLEAMARALFQSWFVDFDPVRATLDGHKPPGMGTPTAALFPPDFDESNVGPIPRGWKTTTIGETCEAIFSGGTPSTKTLEYWNGEFPWLSSGETRNRFIVEAEKKISKAGVENSSTRLAPAGCTVIAGAGQGHTRGQTSLLTLDSYINQSVVALKANPEVSSDLFLFFDLARRYEEFRQLSDSHSSRGSLTTKLLAGVKCVMPSRAIVSAFSDLVGPIVAQITANLHQSNTLTGARNVLLPKLMSGEVLVSN